MRIKMLFYSGDTYCYFRTQFRVIKLVLIFNAFTLLITIYSIEKLTAQVKRNPVLFIYVCNKITN